MDAYQRIIKQTITYIEQGKEISIRRIAKDADVGVGTINYLFNSKDQLIKTCINLMIADVIKESKLNLVGLNQIEKLKLIIKTPVDFIMTHPYISKTSILHDLTNPLPNDNSLETLKRFLAQVSTKEEQFYMTIVLHGLQGIFLRNDLYHPYFDFSNKNERDRLIDQLIDQLFKTYDTQPKS